MERGRGSGQYRNRLQPYPSRSDVREIREQSRNSSQDIFDSTRFYERKQREILEKYNTLTRSPFHDVYIEISTNLGRLAAQDDILLHEEENVDTRQERTASRISREAVINEYNELVEQFNEIYTQHSKDILNYTLQLTDHNNPPFASSL